MSLFLTRDSLQEAGPLSHQDPRREGLETSLAQESLSTSSSALWIFTEQPCARHPGGPTLFCDKTQTLNASKGMTISC